MKTFKFSINDLLYINKIKKRYMKYLRGSSSSLPFIYRNNYNLCQIDKKRWFHSLYILIFIYSFFLI